MLVALIARISNWHVVNSGMTIFAVYSMFKELL